MGFENVEQLPNIPWLSASNAKRNRCRYVILRIYDTDPLKTFINSSDPGQNVRHFADDIFRSIFLNEKLCIMIKMWLKFVPINNNPVMVWIMAWRRAGDKPLSETMLIRFTGAYMQHLGEISKLPGLGGNETNVGNIGTILSQFWRTMSRLCGLSIQYE